MDADLMYWFVCWRKVRTNLRAKNHNELLIPVVPLMFISAVLEQPAPVILWYDDVAEKLREFPILVPNNFFHEKMAADPRMADIDYLGRFCDRPASYSARSFHFSVLDDDIDRREHAYVASGTLMRLHFIFKVARIAVRETGLIAPRHYEAAHLR